MSNKVSQFKYFVTRSKRKEKYFFVGHHKCATQYIKSVLRDACNEKKISIKLSGGDWYRALNSNNIKFNEFICIQNYEKGIFDFSEYHYRGFHVIRDPRDILVSQYFSHRDTHPLTHPFIQEDHDRLLSYSQNEGISYLITESKYFQKLMNEMSHWNYDNNNVYETTFERITGNPFEEFSTIFSNLGIPIEKETLSEILKRNSLSNLRLKYSKGVGVSQPSHYRKGIKGDWKNYLNDVHKDLFKQKYGDMLITLNYEKDVNW